MQGDTDEEEIEEPSHTDVFALPTIRCTDATTRHSELTPQLTAAINPILGQTIDHKYFALHYNDRASNPVYSDDFIITGEKPPNQIGHIIRVQEEAGRKRRPRHRARSRAQRRARRSASHRARRLARQ
jgi:hypothetical protein